MHVYFLSFLRRSLSLANNSINCTGVSLILKVEGHFWGKIGTYLKGQGPEARAPRGYGGTLSRPSKRVPLPGFRLLMAPLLWATKSPTFKVPNYTNLALMTFDRENVCGYDIKLIVAGQIWLLFIKITLIGCWQLSFAPDLLMKVSHMSWMMFVKAMFNSLNHSPVRCTVQFLSKYMLRH